MKPFLKWAGGKSLLAAEIEKVLGHGERLVEPFVGSGAIFVGSCYNDNLLCDTNRDLIGLYNNVKFNYSRLLDELRDLFTPLNNNPEYFYCVRDKFNRLQSEDVLKSAMFVYLNKHAFNGLCRYNRSGFFNVPFGHYKCPLLPYAELEYFSQKASLATFVMQDFRESFRQLRPGDVVYCDPPYVPLSTSSNFTAYSSGGFSEQDQIDLASLAEEARGNGHQVVISNHDTPFTRDLYSKAELIRLKVRRSISSKASTRGFADEVLAIFSPQDYRLR